LRVAKSEIGGVPYGDGASPMMASKSGCRTSFGRLVRKREAEGLILTEAVYAPRQRIPKHSHAWASISLVLDGEYRERTGNREYRCNGQSAGFHPAGQPHSTIFSAEGGRCLNISLDLAFLSDICVHTALLDWSERIPPKLHAKFCEEWGRTDRSSSLALQALVVELFAEIGRVREETARRTPAWLSNVCRQLDAEYQDPPTLTELASSVGLHPVYLAQAFRRQCDCTVGEYVRRRRVEHVCRELRDGNKPLSAVAYSAGFYDQSHLNRVFKRLTGRTPGKFRASNPFHKPPPAP
jgi:AraC family transcriptional regulator